jgi:hypothetical protein
MYYHCYCRIGELEIIEKEKESENVFSHTDGAAIRVLLGGAG